MNQALAFCWYTDMHLQNSGLDYGIIKYDLPNIVQSSN